jgi:4-hydroxy-4-methyl-2-oxoglutarate aldolase
MPNSSASLCTGSPTVVGIITGFMSPWPKARIWGPAFTVKGRAGDNLALHRALSAAPPGHVLVGQLEGDRARGHWGELMSIAAQVRGLAGLVIDNAIRDIEAIADLGFPVFHRGAHPQPADKEFAGELQTPLAVAGVAIRPGDWVFADADGIVIVPREQCEGVLEAAFQVEVKEHLVARQLALGETTMRVFNLDTFDESNAGGT